MNADTTIRLLNVIVPIMTPIVATLVVALRERRSRRSALGRRKLVLDDAHAQVVFVTDWWNARRAIDGSEGLESSSAQEAARQARAWLNRASQLVADNELSLPRSASAMTFRRMALLYPFRTTAGMVARAAFWVFCGLTTTTVGATVSEAIAPAPAGRELVRWFVLAGAVIIPLTLVLRFVAVAVDQVAAQPSVQGRETYGFMRELLLLRRLQGRGAGVVRALFYLSAIWTIVYAAISAWLESQPRYSGQLPLSVTGFVVYGTVTFAIRAWALYIDLAARRQSLPAQEKARDQVAESILVP